MSPRDWAAVGIIAAGAITLPILLFISAPYGRYGRSGWGPGLPTRWAWFLMESPALWAFGLFFVLGPRYLEPVPLILAALWLLHYMHRVLVYPLKRVVRPGDKTPWAIAAMAFVFNIANGYVNGGALSAIESPYFTEWLRQPNFVVGAVLFLGGTFGNRQADATLAELRRNTPLGEYGIPRAGMFRLISSPNYFFEILEWTGWALCTWSLAGASFCFFTIANLLPRALTHHRWYKQRFTDYPPERRAIIPFVL